MDFKIQTMPQMQVEIIQPTQPYQITYYKDAIDENGNTIKVEDRKDYITMEQLESQKTVLRSKIAEIDAQLAEIASADIKPVPEEKMP